MMQPNAQQQRVIDQLDRNILLLASAGTGKTNTLACRVAHILATQKATAEQILCMTFTNKACKEMKERVMGLAGQEAKAVEVSTFHSFCYMILQDEAKRADGLFNDLIIYDEEDSRELLTPLKPDGINDFNFQNLMGTIKEHRAIYGYYSDDLLADYGRTIERLFTEQGEYMNNFFYSSAYRANTLLVDGPNFMRREGARLVVAYQEALRNAHGVDFTDLITMVYELFTDEAVCAHWRQRYRYICIDEMQDTSELEYMVMKQLWPGNVVLLSGDYFQTIYEWRGSNPMLLLDGFRQEFNPETIVFYENYRSNRTLFTAAFTVLRHMFPREIGQFYEEMPQAVATKEGTPITVVAAANEWAESEYIFNQVRALPQGTAGILVRNNNKAKFLSRAFERFNDRLPATEQLAFTIIDDFKFFRRQEIKDVMAFFKLLLNPHDVVSAKRLIKRFVRGIGEARVAAIESEDCRLSGLKLNDFMDTDIFAAEPYEKLLAALDADNIVVYDVESTGTDTTKDEIIQIAALRLGKEGQEIEIFERFIRPSKSVGDSEAVHGFSDAYLAEHGDEARAVLAEFREFSRGAVIVGHNVNYDVSIFRSELHRHNLGDPAFGGIYDTLDIFRRFYPNLANHKLGFLSEHFPINHKPTHNAMDDIRATALLLLYAVRENIRPTQDKRRSFIASYKSAFSEIATQMATLRRKSYQEWPTNLLAYIMNDMGVVGYYKERNEMNRVEYIRELYRLLGDLQKECQAINMPKRDCLSKVMQMAVLTAGEPDPRLKSQGRIPIITVHQAKGSEFDAVFLAGMNEGVFPSALSVKEGKLQEEQRLFYVALTRAKEQLTITYALKGGRDKELRPSSFLAYLPTDLVKQIDGK